MACLEFRKNSKWWYGRFQKDKKTYVKNLNVVIDGQRPNSINDFGSRRFETSRAKAQAELDNLIKSTESKKNAEELAQTIHEIRTGERVETALLSELPHRWRGIKRKRLPSERYATQCESTLTRFVDFINRRFPNTEELYQVSRKMAIAFLDAEETRGITGKTWNDVLKLLRSTFRHLRKDAGLIYNVFDEIPTTDIDTIYRQPFSPEELKCIVEAASTDDFIRPIIIAAICSAMRRGDCCLLRWKDVDLEKRFITVKTSKTKQTVDIPIFPLFFDELSHYNAGESEYVFEQQALMYQSNPDGITWRVRKVFAKAGFRDKDSKKKNDIAYRGDIHADREIGLRKASIRDFHSFRVTWVTLALTAGVPLEIVKKVTGHKTTDVVLTHYFQPGREAFRVTLQSAMPSLLTDGSLSKDQRLLELLEKQNSKNWKKVNQELRETLING